MHKAFGNKLLSSLFFFIFDLKLYMIFILHFHLKNLMTDKGIAKDVWELKCSA